MQPGQQPPQGFQWDSAGQQQTSPAPQMLQGAPNMLQGSPNMLQGAPQSADGEQRIWSKPDYDATPIDLCNGIISCRSLGSCWWFFNKRVWMFARSNFTSFGEQRPESDNHAPGALGSWNCTSCTNHLRNPVRPSVCWVVNFPFYCDYI